MNEVKRQLLEKMGGTSERAARVKTNIRNATMQRPKKKSYWPYYAAFATFAAALLLFLVAEPWVNDDKHDNQRAAEEQPIATSYKEELRQFFMADGSTAYFEGEGYAHVDYMLETEYLAEDFIRTIETSGAIELERIYYIDDNAIYIAFEEEVIIEPKKWTEERLSQLKADLRGPEFIWPLEVGAQVGDYKVEETNVTLTTPFQTFENVIVLQSQIGDATFRDFYVKGFGKVRSEMLEGDEIVVYRELTTIGDPSPNFELAQNTTPSQVEPVQRPQMPETVTLTSDLTGEQMAFPVYEIVPIRERLQVSRDVESEIARMSYTELYVPLENSIFYLLKLNCSSAKFCEVYLLSKVKDYRAVPVGKGIVDDYVEFSPNMQRALIRLSVKESQFVVRNQLAIVDVFAMQRNYVQTKTEYFSAATWPIEKYGWIDNETIVIKTAEVFDSSATAIEGWKINSGTLMDVEIPIPIAN